MKKSKRYKLARFSADVIAEAGGELRSVAKLVKGQSESLLLSVEIAEGEWRHESEAEFFADYRQSVGDAWYALSIGSYGLKVHALDEYTLVRVDAPARPAIETVFSIFEKHLENSLKPEPPPIVVRPNIFIGHGKSPLWRDLKDHLHEKHGLEIQAYEIGARAGHTIRDILKDMLKKSSFALFVSSAKGGSNSSAPSPSLPRIFASPNRHHARTTSPGFKPSSIF